MPRRAGAATHLDRRFRVCAMISAETRLG